MPATLLAIGLFLFWNVLGSVLLSGLKAGVDGGRQLLIAPAVGAATCVLPIFWINWWGVPIRQFAWPLLAGLALIAIALSWRRRPTLVRQEIPHLAAPLAAALVLNGWPLFTHGFEDRKSVV